MKIIVGLSGGVDSSVAAYLLAKQGYQVEAMFMQNWHDTTGTLHGECEWEDEKAIAEMVAKKIGIPFHFVDLSDKYREQVVDYMFSEYEAGRTPNPDVLCNSKIKFDAFLKCALDLGADYVATGHYCKKESELILNSDGTQKEIFKLISGDDPNKDQSYFLCQLSQNQLKRALFPIGHLTKPQVREIAKQAQLPSADKKDSQGICFVGKVDLPVFLQQKIKPNQGDVVEIFEKDFSSIQSRELERVKTSEEYLSSAPDIQRLLLDSHQIQYSNKDGKIIGKHIGVQFYTLGQRHGLNIGGHANSIFIISTDIATNTIFVGEGKDHSGMFRKALRIKSSEIHWIREDIKMLEGESRDYLVRIRYRQPLQRATLHMTNLGLFISFEQPQRSITPGQFAAWYNPDNKELIGSGTIS